MKIFGREPAALIGVVETFLVLLMAFRLGVDQELLGAIMAVVTAGFGVYSAYVTKDTLLGAAVGLLKSALILAAVFGFTLTADQTAAVIALVTVGLSLFQRTQTTPLANPSFEREPVTV